MPTEPLKKLKKTPTERALWNRIRSKFNDAYDRAYRIEAVATPGFPDVIWCPYMRSPIFIELKAGPFRIRPAQRKFINDMHRCGIHVWVIWQKKANERVLVWRGEYLIHNVSHDVHGAEYLEDWMARMKGY